MLHSITVPTQFNSQDKSEEGKYYCISLFNSDVICDGQQSQQNHGLYAPDNTLTS